MKFLTAKTHKKPRFTHNALKAAALALVIALSAGCAAGGTDMTITAAEAKKIIDGGGGCVVLDVRTEEEFSGGHVPGAVLIPLDELEKRVSEEIPDTEATVLVYCRSGRRSAQAARLLASLGYANVKDFGGILSWPYETEK